MTHERWKEILALQKQRKTSLKVQDELIAVIERMCWGYRGNFVDRLKQITDEMQVVLPLEPITPAEPTGRPHGSIL